VESDGGEPTAAAGIGVGHRGRAALVASCHEATSSGDHRVRQVEVAGADHPEDVVDADCCQRRADGLGDVH
jgi:hypothetical protein